MKGTQVTVTISCDGHRKDFPDEVCPSKLVIGPVAIEYMTEAIRNEMKNEGWVRVSPRCPTCQRDIPHDEKQLCPKCKPKEVLKE